MKYATIKRKLYGFLVMVIMLVSFILPSTIKAANIDYLIVLPENLSESVVNEFVSFKEQQGFEIQITPVNEITKSTTGTDDAEKIRNYFKNMQSRQIWGGSNA